MFEPLHILIDSREQCPWAWSPEDAVTEIVGLAAGDYALEADTEKPKRAGQMRPVRFSLERKNLEDLLSTISTGWERFQRELTRMESFPARVVIVEGDFKECCFQQRSNGELIPPQHNHPNLGPLFVARRVAELTMMGVSVLFAGDAQLAAGLAFRIFKRRLEVNQ
jgi:ERCC4-type nuclease